MTRWIAGSLLGAIMTLATSPAIADERSGSAISIGIRLGYGIPFGSTSDDTNNLSCSGCMFGGKYGVGPPLGSPDLRSTVSGMVPLWLDAGYKFTPHIYLGAFFMYGVGFMPSTFDSVAIMMRVLGPYTVSTCNSESVTCSAHDLQFGVNAHYHVMPDEMIDPWLGIGFGYEVLAGRSSYSGYTSSFSTAGFQFLNLQVGADYKVTPKLGVGPFASLSLGKYTSQTVDHPPTHVSGDVESRTFHEWLILGVRSVYDLGL